MKNIKLNTWADETEETAFKWLAKRLSQIETLEDTKNVAKAINEAFLMDGITGDEYETLCSLLGAIAKGIKPDAKAKAIVELEASAKIAEEIGKREKVAAEDVKEYITSDDYEYFGTEEISPNEWAMRFLIYYDKDGLKWPEYGETPEFTTYDVTHINGVSINDHDYENLSDGYEALMRDTATLWGMCEDIAEDINSMLE